MGRPESQHDDERSLQYGAPSSESSSDAFRRLLSISQYELFNPGYAGCQGIPSLARDRRWPSGPNKPASCATGVKTRSARRDMHDAWRITTRLRQTHYTASRHFGSFLECFPNLPPEYVRQHTRNHNYFAVFGETKAIRANR